MAGGLGVSGGWEWRIWGFSRRALPLLSLWRNAARGTGRHPRGLATAPLVPESLQNLSRRGPLAAGGEVGFRSCPSVGILA